MRVVVRGGQEAGVDGRDSTKGAGVSACSRACATEGERDGVGVGGQGGREARVDGRGSVKGAPGVSACSCARATGMGGAGGRFFSSGGWC